MRIMRVGIIGTGAAAYAAISTLRKLGARLNITVFDPDPGPSSHRQTALARKDYRTWTADDFNKLHAAIKDQVGTKFPPPKTDFGELIPHIDTTIGRDLSYCIEPGGLTRYWSASLFPFADGDFRNWEISGEDLAPYYQKIADYVGIAGRNDSLDRYFGADYVTRPEIEPTALAKTMLAALDDNPGGDKSILSGLNRLAIETREGHDCSCVRCGGCFYGCFRGAIFDAGEALNRLDDEIEFQRTGGKVIRIEALKSGASIRTETGDDYEFDHVFCGAGCLASLEIALRSFADGREQLHFVDNDQYIFPIFYLGRGIDDELDAYLAIANIVAGFLPELPGDNYAQAHIAPIPDYLFRFYLPGQYWRYVKWICGLLRARVLLVRLSVDGDVSPQFSAQLNQTGRLNFEMARVPNSKELLSRLRRRLRRSLAGSDFYLPAFPAMPARTSYHYAGGLDAANGSMPTDSLGRLAPHIHFIDSATFPNSPAQSITFTIMANAARIVTEVMNG